MARANVHAKALMATFRANGVACAMEKSFREFAALTGSRGRVFCAAEPGPAGGKASWSGFWFHAGSGLVFVGTFAGPCYRLQEPGSCIALLLALGRYSGAARSAPYVVPPALVEEFNLVRGDFFEIWPRTGIRRLDVIQHASSSRPFERTKVIQALRKNGVRCEFGNNRLIWLMYGKARAITRCRGRDKLQKSLAVFIEGGDFASIDHAELLRILPAALGANIYDSGWNTQVDFDDPYYRYTENAQRPNEPRRWFPWRS